MDQISNTQKPTWIPLKLSKSVHSYGHTSVPFKNYIITFGGTDDSTILNETFALLMGVEKWQTIDIIGEKPAARYGHSACMWENNRGIIFGGKGASIMNEVLLMNFTLSPLSVEYKVIATKKALGMNRMWHTANICEGNLYVFGGKSNKYEGTNDLLKLDLTKFSWEKCETTGYTPEVRSSHSSVVCNNKIYYFGGYCTKYKRNLADLFCLDPNKMEWTQLSYGETCPEPRRGVSLIARDEKLYIFGGKQDNNNYFNDIYSYNLNDRLGWMKIEAEEDSAPPTRGWQTCTPYKSGFVVWGGARGVIIFNDIFSLQFEEESKENNNIKVIGIEDQIKRMYAEKIFCDITFEVEGKKFQAHKGILASRSQYFTNMFNSGMIESQSDTISIPDVKAHIFEAFLEFIYGNGIKKTELELMLGLSELAEKWVVSDLKSQCSQFLIQDVSLTNVVKIGALAELYDNEALKDKVMKFMVKNFQALEDENILEQLPKSIFIQFTSSVIKDLS